MPALSSSAVDGLALDLVNAALSTTSIDEFRRETFRHLDAVIGCDTCVSWGFPVSRMNVTLVGISQAPWDIYLADPRRFDDDMTPLNQAAARAGAIQDVDVLPVAARDRSSFYREIIAPIGVSCFLSAPLFRLGQIIGVVNFGRRGSRYDASRVDALKRLAPALAIGEALHAAPTFSAESCALDQLTRREREIVSLMQIGLSNREIAGMCGLSPNTIRNHLANAYAKAGASNRVELLRFLREGNLSRRRK